KISLELKALKTAISKIHPENNVPYSLKTIQEKLAKDSAALCTYFFGKDTIYQFVISEKDIVVERIILTTDIRENIVDFIHLFDDGSIINNDISNYTNLAFQIFQLLKFNNLSAYKNVVIIPDGLLKPYSPLKQPPHCMQKCLL